jgi:hypothetical protein
MHTSLAEQEDSAHICQLDGSPDRPFPSSATDIQNTAIDFEASFFHLVQHRPRGSQCFVQTMLLDFAIHNSLDDPSTHVSIRPASNSVILWDEGPWSERESSWL